MQEESNQQQGALFVVATPIGNLEDITLRALRVLREASMIVCEDTRVAKKLLFHYEIQATLLAIPQRVDEGKLQRVIEALKAGKNVALITDAGTPGISDPGNEVVAGVIASGYTVSPIPGASALGTLLSVAGVNTQEFLFKGFPPHKKGRKTFFESVAASSVPIVFYESPHRILKALESLAEVVAEKRIIVGRELTKTFEEIVRGTPQEVLQYYQDHPEKVKGEFVILVG